MRRNQTSVIAVVFTLGLSSALHGYAVEPAPDMLSELKNQVSGEVTTDSFADVCVFQLDIPTDASAEQTPYRSCDAQAAKVGF